MKAVTNSSVLIGLGSIERLDLPQQRFPEGILVPRAVWREVVEEGKDRPGAQEIAAARWISVRDVGSRHLIRLLQEELDDGEAEAIALAHEIGAGVVLLDERDARRKARQLGLRPGDRGDPPVGKAYRKAWELAGGLRCAPNPGQVPDQRRALRTCA